ncbi:hypothetical protein [Streptococcus pluranimalium]|uniref:Uncharacterized protein n=1 Tax=Streptococcus pluranimalium TaxID=82348 RepID=A0A345VII3_9STRE|nr:hypothetical protein [Streptococcus pluranimalium]AXJ12535.1 hypothetical protein Sp14A_06050 [Streptococcus pluranimalium]
MQVTIKIDGASADELFAVGPNDLLNYFLPEALGVKKEDVVSIYMSDGKEKAEESKDFVFVEGYTVHKDNYHRVC